MNFLGEYVKNQEEDKERKANGLKYFGLVNVKLDKISIASKAFKEIVEIYEKILTTNKNEFLENPDRISGAKENIAESIKFFKQHQDNIMVIRAKKILNLIK